MGEAILARAAGGGGGGLPDGTVGPYDFNFVKPDGNTATFAEYLSGVDVFLYLAQYFSTSSFPGSNIPNGQQIYSNSKIDFTAFSEIQLVLNLGGSYVTSNGCYTRSKTAVVATVGKPVTLTYADGATLTLEFYLIGTNALGLKTRHSGGTNYDLTGGGSNTAMLIIGKK